MRTSSLAAIGAIVLAQASAYAQPDPAPALPRPAEPATTPTPETVSSMPPPTPPGMAIAMPPEDKRAEAAQITVAGYLEAYYQAHFQDPSNHLTNLRGYDNRSRSLTLSNVAVDLKGEKGPVTARIILQVGHTPSTYYLAEPVSPGTGSVNASSSELWSTSRRRR